MSLHIVVGQVAEGADGELESAAGSGEVLGWTVPRVAVTGDDLVFYLLKPVGAFVATGRVLTDARPGSSFEGHGDYLSDVGEIRMLSAPVERLRMAEQVPAWGWPRQPRTATTVPDASVDDVLGALGLG